MQFQPLQTQNSNQQIDLGGIGLFIVIVVTVTAWRWWQRYQTAKIVSEGPMIMAIYTNGVRLQKMSEGTLDGLGYDLMLTEPVQLPQTDGPREYPDSLNPLASITAQAASDIAETNSTMAGDGKIIMMYHLGVKSPVHISCFGAADEATQLSLRTSATENGLVPAELEGDFPDYFELFCKSNQQVELREVLDPATMEFLVDYCKRQDWELFEDTLYFAENGVLKKIENTADSKSMVEDAQNFITKVLPVLQRMSHSATQ